MYILTKSRRLFADISAIILLISVNAAAIYGLVRLMLCLDGFGDQKREHTGLAVGISAIFGVCILMFSLSMIVVQACISDIRKLVGDTSCTNAMHAVADGLPSYADATHYAENSPSPSYADALRNPPSYRDVVRNNPPSYDEALALIRLKNNGTPSATFENADLEMTLPQLKQIYS